MCEGNICCGARLQKARQAGELKQLTALNRSDNQLKLSLLP